MNVGLKGTIISFLRKGFYFGEKFFQYLTDHSIAV